MICGQCGTQNKPGDRFCEQCGAPLDGPASSVGLAATVVDAPVGESALVRQDGDQRYPLGDRVVVGRMDTCDLTVNDKSVSREHARLSRLQGGYVVEDLGSTNGTLVNGQRIHEPVLLRPNDMVTFGAIDFRFESSVPQAALDQNGTVQFQYSAMAQPPEAGTIAFSLGQESQPEPANGTAQFSYEPEAVSEVGAHTPDVANATGYSGESADLATPTSSFEPSGPATPASAFEPSAPQPSPAPPPIVDFPPLEPFAPPPPSVPFSGESAQPAPPAGPLPAQPVPPTESLPAQPPSLSEPYPAQTASVSEPFSAQSPPVSEPFPAQGISAPDPFPAQAAPVFAPPAAQTAPQPNVAQAQPPVASTPSEYSSQSAPQPAQVSPATPTAGPGFSSSVPYAPTGRDSSDHRDHPDAEKAVRDATDAVARLAELVRTTTASTSAHRAELERQTAELERARARVSELEEAARARDAVRSALQKAPNGAIGADQIDKLRSAVTAALQNPRDIDVLRALAEMARDLSAVVDGYSQQRHTLDEIAASIGSPSP